MVVPNLINQRLSAGIATRDIPFQGIRNLHIFYNIALNIQMENNGQILDLIPLLFLIDIIWVVKSQGMRWADHVVCLG